MLTQFISIDNFLLYDTFLRFGFFTTLYNSHSALFQIIFAILTPYFIARKYLWASHCGPIPKLFWLSINSYYYFYLYNIYTELLTISTTIAFTHSFIFVPALELISKKGTEYWAARAFSLNFEWFCTYLSLFKTDLSLLIRLCAK